MDRYTPIEDPALGLDRTLSSWSILFDNNPLRQDIFVEGTKIVLHDAYHVFQNLVSNYMGTHPVAGIGTSEEVCSYMTNLGMSDLTPADLLTSQSISTCSLVTISILRTLSWRRLGTR